MAFVIETDRFTAIYRSIVIIFALNTLSSISQHFNGMYVKINKMMPTSVTRIDNVAAWKSATKILSTYLWNFRFGRSIQQSHFAISWSFKLKLSLAKNFWADWIHREKNIVTQLWSNAVAFAFGLDEMWRRKRERYSLEWSQTKIAFRKLVNIFVYAH